MKRSGMIMCYKCDERKPHSHFEARQKKYENRIRYSKVCNECRIKPPINSMVRSISRDKKDHKLREPHPLEWVMRQWVRGAV